MSLLISERLPFFQGQNLPVAVLGNRNCGWKLQWASQFKERRLFQIIRYFFFLFKLTRLLWGPPLGRGWVPTCQIVLLWRGRVNDRPRSLWSQNWFGKHIPNVFSQNAQENVFEKNTSMEYLMEQTYLYSLAHKTVLYYILRKVCLFFVSCIINAFNPSSALSFNHGSLKK